MKLKLLKSIVISTLVMSTPIDARVLSGFSNIEFGMPFEQVKSLTEHKPDFEIWNKKSSDDDNLKYSVVIDGEKMTARVFFKENIADGFNVSSTSTTSSENVCVDKYLNVIERLEKKYGPVTNPAVNEGWDFLADFSFSNSRHINVYGSYDSNFQRNKCLIIVWYHNYPLTRKMPETIGTKSSHDSF